MIKRDVYNSGLQCSIVTELKEAETSVWKILALDFVNKVHSIRNHTITVVKGKRGNGRLQNRVWLRCLKHVLMNNFSALVFIRLFKLHRCFFCKLFQSHVQYKSAIDCIRFIFNIVAHFEDWKEKIF